MNKKQKTICHEKQREHANKVVVGHLKLIIESVNICLRWLEKSNTPSSLRDATPLS